MRLLNKILVVVILLACAVSTGATTVNSNSKIVDGIEYYVQTDKFTYQLGENAQMMYRVTNLSGQNVTFGFPSGHDYKFWVEKNDVRIWQWGYPAIQVPTQFTLAPGQYQEFPGWGSPLPWNLRDNSGNSVQAGHYEVIGGLYNDIYGYNIYDYSEVSVPIEIVPEPATLLLLALGAAGSRLIRRKRRSITVR